MTKEQRSNSLAAEVHSNLARVDMTSVLSLMEIRRIKDNVRQSMAEAYVPGEGSLRRLLQYYQEAIPGLRR